MVGDYISREAALSAQNKSMNLAECRKRLERLPAADVVEVRHGRWNEVEHGENGVLCECSTCKEWMLFYYGFDANFCPNCGAKMDGGQDE